MINIKKNHEIAIMKESGRILAEIFRLIEPQITAGITTEEIDQRIEKLINKFQVMPSFKNFQGYEYVSCISVNEELVHGLPSKRLIKNGDIVGVDIGIQYRGYHADSARTIAIGKISPLARKLLDVTEDALTQAIKNVKHGVNLSKIQAIIQSTAHKNGFSVVKTLTGHGIGKNLQEAPAIANYVHSKQSITLLEGMTICIEPMFNAGREDVMVKNDGWTVQTRDMSLSAHFEHTIAVGKNGCEVLTL